GTEGEEQAIERAPAPGHGRARDEATDLPVLRAAAAEARLLAGEDAVSDSESSQRVKEVVLLRGPGLQPVRQDQPCHYDRQPNLASHRRLLCSFVGRSPFGLEAFNFS